MRSRAVEELDWRDRDDARTLAEAIEIRSDKDRYARAVKAASVIAMASDAQANAMKKVAGGRVKSLDTMAGLNETLRATVANI